MPPTNSAPRSPPSPHASKMPPANHALNAAYIEAIEKSLATTRAMNTLVDRLLSLARFDSANFQTELANTTLAEVVERSTESFTDQAERRQIKLDTNISDDLSLETDPALLQVIIDNLVENAVSYTGQGSTVSVAATRDNDTLHLSISNPCISISESDTNHVFDPFWRGDTARTDATIHAGLGLSICQKITSLLGGSISAKTENGAFSVHLALPVA